MICNDSIRPYASLEDIADADITYPRASTVAQYLTIPQQNNRLKQKKISRTHLGTSAGIDSKRKQIKKSTRRLILAKTFIIFAVENENIMQYDIIYPDDESHIQETPCVIAASYFDADELIGFGVNPDADEVHEPFIDDNEFEKIFKLWDSPLYLRKFYADNIEYFKQEYWDGITEDEFVRDVTHSLNEIRAKIINLFRNHNISTAVEPLEPKEADLRLYQSIRVKLKQGWIHNRFAFRFYAIEIEEKKCYLITGATIKIHKDMKKAPNTNIELEKLKYALNELSSNGVDTKELFFEFIL